MSNAVAKQAMGSVLGPKSSKFATVKVEELGAGISSGFGVIGYKGKIWSIKHGGVEHKLLRPDDGSPQSSIELVILRAGEAVSKVYYGSNYAEGSNTKPDCQSVNGVRPDKTIAKPVHPQCADCPMNQWGAHVTEDGKAAKACQDVKRLAVVPQNNIRNEAMGGPLLLRVPPASLKELKMYSDQLMGHGFPYFAVATRIRFDIEKAFPKFIFSAIRALDDEEADAVLAMRDDPRTKRITDEAVEFLDAAPAEPPAEQQPVASSLFEQPPATQPQTPVQAQEPAPATPVRRRATKAAPEAPKAPEAPIQQATPDHDPETGEVVDDEEAELMRRMAELQAKKAAAKAPAAPAPAPAKPAAAKPAAAPPPSEEDEDFDSLLDSLVTD